MTVLYVRKKNVHNFNPIKFLHIFEEIAIESN